MEAVTALERYATPATRLALTDIIENENCFYKVRCDAAFCLAKVNSLNVFICFCFSVKCLIVVNELSSL